MLRDEQQVSRHIEKTERLQLFISPHQYRSRLWSNKRCCGIIFQIGWCEEITTRMREVLSFIEVYDGFILLGLAFLVLVLLVYSGILSRRLARINSRREIKIEEGRLEDILDHLSEQAKVVAAMQARVDELNIKHREQSSNLSSCIQRIGIVRFNAFEDVGGEQSFAMALLDADNNGVVISSLYGRHDSRLYAKSVTGGRGERALSEEEQSAINKALSA